MLPGDELHVFAGECRLTIVGDRHAFFIAQGEAGVQHPLAGPEDECIVGMVFAVDTKDIE